MWPDRRNNCGAREYMPLLLVLRKYYCSPYSSPVTSAHPRVTHTPYLPRSAYHGLGLLARNLHLAPYRARHFRCVKVTNREDASRFVAYHESAPSTPRHPQSHSQWFVRWPRSHLYLPCYANHFGFGCIVVLEMLPFPPSKLWAGQDYACEANPTSDSSATTFAFRLMAESKSVMP